MWPWTKIFFLFNLYETNRLLCRLSMLKVVSFLFLVPPLFSCYLFCLSCLYTFYFSGYSAFLFACLSFYLSASISLYISLFYGQFVLVLIPREYLKRDYRCWILILRQDWFIRWLLKIVYSWMSIMNTGRFFSVQKLLSMHLMR